MVYSDLLTFNIKIYIAFINSTGCYLQPKQIFIFFLKNTQKLIKNTKIITGK